jgi:hypothetical protein
MTKLIAKIFPPHSEKQALVMKHLGNRNTKTKTLWLACGTKWGKSISASASLAYAAPRFPNTLWRWLAPIQKQTKIGRRYIKNMWPPEPHIKENKADNIIYIPKRNIELQFWHGQNPEDLEGEAVFGQVSDECAKLKEQALTSSRTTWTLTQAQRLNISTPRGRNFFYRGCMRAKEEMLRARHEKREPREIFLCAPTRDNPFVPQESIDEARRLLPDRLFRQYYLAEFIDDGEVLPRPVIDNDSWKEPYVRTSDMDIWIHPDHGEISIVAGADWAKTTDYTVLTCWDYSRRPFRCVGFMRMQGKKYPEQLVLIARFLFRFKACDMLYHDKTGLGNVIDDLLEEIPGLIYHGITFSNATKAEMVNSMITTMEIEDAIFPWWPELLGEFDAYEVQTDALGRMRYNAAEGAHDDIVTSCFLGLSACEEYSTKTFEVKFLEDLPKAETQKDTWENYLYESLDIDPEEGF